jgi:hypothetical protein
LSLKEKAISDFTSLEKALSISLVLMITLFLVFLAFFCSLNTLKGQAQCQRLPYEWGLGKGITETKSYPRRNSAESIM